MPIKVETYDIDLAGHVNNIVYIKWLEVLRTGLLKLNGSFKELIQNGYYLVVISTNIIYRKQLKIFDEPVGRMELKEIRHNVITFNATIKLAEEIYAKAEQRCVVLDMKTSRMVHLDASSGTIKIKFAHTEAMK